MLNRVFRCFTTSLIVFGFLAVYAPRVSAQSVVIAMYTDMAIDYNSGVIQFYTAFSDESDMSAWPGAYHYDYFTYATASGSTGSDSEQGAGLGPFWLQVPVPAPGAEASWDLYASVSFECSVAGPLWATTAIFTIQSYPFNYHYNNAGYAGDEQWRYIPKTPAIEKRCKVDNLYFGGNSPSGLTLSGLLIVAPPLPGLCAGVCTAGWDAIELGPNGVAAHSGECANLPFGF